MPFKLDNLNPPARFPYNESEWIEVRNINIAKIKEFRKKVVKKKIEYKRGQRFEYEETDDELMNALMWDYQIVDWNIQTTDGEEIECTKENKVLMMEYSPEFADFFVECIDQLRRDEAKQVEDSEKNLPSS
jgi:hypothetical protein